MTTPTRITTTDEQHAVERDLMHDRNEYERIRRLTEQRRTQKKMHAPEGKLVQTLGAMPKEEFAPLHEDTTFTTTPKKISDDEEDEDLADEMDSTEIETKLPPINPADISTIPSDLTTERAQLRNDRSAAARRPSAPALDSQIGNTEQQLILLNKNLKETRRKEKQKKIQKEIAKMVATAEAILTIIYYVIKIIFIALFLYRDGPETRAIKKQIRQQEASLSELKKQRNKTILIQRQRQA